MARKKTTNLFNKNHISLIKVENDNNNDNSIVFHEPSYSSKKNSYGNWKFSEKTQRIDTWVNRAIYKSSSSIVFFFFVSSCANLTKSKFSINT